MTSPTHGVPGSLEFCRGAGSMGVRVYKCTECGRRFQGTARARKHTTCHPASECPVCGQHRARPSLGTDYGRVDDCRCNAVFRSREEVE